MKHKFLNKKKNKYNAIKVRLDGITFDSKKESEYYLNLKLLARGGLIRDLECHPSYQIVWPSGGEICRVELDFTFYDIEKGCVRFIDVKGFPTEVSKIKRKLLEAQNKITVEWV